MKWILNSDGKLESIESDLKVEKAESSSDNSKKEYTTDEVRLIVKKHNRYERAKASAIISLELLLIVITIMCTLIAVNYRTTAITWIFAALYLTVNISCLVSCWVRDASEIVEKDYALLKDNKII